ncbi:MAG: tetraacyldisaccharide 4'-kinase [Bacteroidota bacterium]|nr:MAG: tetraacyldisaccharide 4'-kinase [Bacteroidota bacterium]
MRWLLIPFTPLYGLVVRIRHKLFDWKILKSVRFEVATICVGNITVGGTGKTPHIEYLVDLLHKSLPIAVLSRGYGRRTKGFVLAGKKSTPISIGDESYQIFRKYNNILVAVCEKRVKGIKNLLETNRKIKVILLDDAFQHRYVDAGLNIVLIDYNRPVFKDIMLPAGNLRDSRNQLKRADIVLVTKVPDTFSPLEKRLWMNELKLFPYQKLFFTSLVYKNAIPLFKETSEKLSVEKIKKENGIVLLVTGIANPTPLKNYLESNEITFQHLEFADHHLFNESDLERIRIQFDLIPGRKKIILTTEKDAVRLKTLKRFPRSLRDKTYYLPIRINFLEKSHTEFDKLIVNYVTKNKKIGRIHP